MNKNFLILFLSMLFYTHLSAQTIEENIQQWSSEELFKVSTSQNLMPSEEGIKLSDQILIEDDAPASGYSSNPGALEILKDGVILKKILIVDKLPVHKAFIAAMVYPDFPPEPNNGRHIIFNVNGNDISYEVKHFWTQVPVPADYLKTGENIITLRTKEDDTRFNTYVALDQNFKIGSLDLINSPGRSLKSNDGGKTWSKNLGINNEVSGEYSVRLKLVGSHPNGSLITPVIDIAENSNIDDVIKQKVQINNFEIEIYKNEPEGTKLIVEDRTGSSSFINDSWSEWKKYSGDIIDKSIQGRYLQLKITFTSDSHLNSPVIKHLSVKSSYKIISPPGLNTIHVISSKNHPLINSSFTFEYEDPKLPELQEFRKKYQLDEVVKDAATEFEKLLKLKTWVAKQWKWHLLKPDEEIIEWNADEILTPDSEGVIGGFCANYAIVYMQALQSFGIPCRFVIMNYSVWGGHEVLEVWSNDYGKWVMMDPNYDTYFADPETGIPYNALELHKIFLKEYYPNSIINRDDWSRENFVKKASDIGKDVPVICLIGGGANGGTLKKYEWWKPTVELYPYSGGLGFLNAGYLRYMPRNNFLSQPFPVPVNEGRTHWPWTGYYCWYDEQTPPTVEHKIFTTRINDLYWNLNEVDFSASLKNSGQLTIEMNTNSPNFDHYEIIFNNKKAETKENIFNIDLAHGKNEIRILVVDIMGNKGTESYLNLVYLPEDQQSSGDSSVIVIPSE